MLLLLASKNLKSNIGFWVTISSVAIYVFVIIRYASKGTEWLNPLVYYYINLINKIKINSLKIINPQVSSNSQRIFLSSEVLNIISPLKTKIQKKTKITITFIVSTCISISKKHPNHF